MDLFATALSQSPVPRHRPRRQRRFRGAAAGYVTLAVLLGTAGVSATPAAAAATSTAVSGAALVDWSGRGRGDQSWGGQTARDPRGGGTGGSTSGDDAATVDSEPATAAQSEGVVLIDTVLSYEGAEGAGTGVVLTSSGQVMTNYHVVEGATKITVTVASTGKTYAAEVVGHDETHDIALLQLEDASGLEPVTIDDDSVAVGDDVTAVGNAGGTGTLTAADGTVTSLTASVTTSAEGTVAGETLSSMIETSADVVAGDSGGPLYDDEGEMIGIDTAASTGSEINGYAIPISEALDIVDQIRSGDATSTVRIGPSAFLGVTVSDAGSATGGRQNSAYGRHRGGGFADVGSATEEGAVIGGVVDDSPADTAGLVAGDVLTEIDSQEIGSATQVSELLAEHSAGDRVKITWTDTDGTSHTATVTLIDSPVA
ncbi:MAG: trypsin-like peptidase domain-containing protein [Microlunatus sp.]